MAKTSALDYILSLVPGFKRNLVEDDIDRLILEIKENTLPPMITLDRTFKDVGFNDSEVKGFIKEFTRLKLNRSKNGFTSFVVYQLENTLEMLQSLDDIVDSFFGKDIATAGLTYKKTNFLRLLDAISFNLGYTRKLVLYFLSKEQSKLGGGVGSALTKAEVKWLASNRTNYFNTLRILSIPAKGVEGLLLTVPEIVVTPENVEVIDATTTDDTIDPLRLNFLPPSINPFYRIGKLVIEWQASRYKVAVEEKRALEYRLMAIKELRSDVKDAKLESEIIETEERIKQLSFKLAKLEE